MAQSFRSWEERALSEPGELAERELLLRSRGLSVPGGESLVLGFYDQGRLAATGALVGKVLEGIAVAREAEGEGGAAEVVTALIKAALGRGIGHLFLFSKPEEGRRFAELGFAPLASAVLGPGPGTGGALGAAVSRGRGVALLEWGSPGIEDWKASLARAAEGKPRGAGVVVVNCNPFTLGHRKLLEFAASSVPWLYVLVVEEERSLFPFAARIELVRRGSRDIPNLSVLPGGPYVISSATFPTYFTRPEPGQEEGRIAELHAALDLELFRRHAAPALGAAARFVGTEPYCPTTSVYNRLMKEILPDPGREGPALRVVEMPRFERGGEAVSASRVRRLIREGELAAVRPLVPPSTWEWLTSPEAGPVIERIKASDSRH